MTRSLTYVWLEVCGWRPNASSATARSCSSGWGCPRPST
jgi:hypothetical protein